MTDEQIKHIQWRNLTMKRYFFALLLSVLSIAACSAGDQLTVDMTQPLLNEKGQPVKDVSDITPADPTCSKCAVVRAAASALTACALPSISICVVRAPAAAVAAAIALASASAGAASAVTRVVSAVVVVTSAVEADTSVPSHYDYVAVAALTACARGVCGARAAASSSAAIDPRAARACGARGAAAPTPTARAALIHGGVEHRARRADRAGRATSWAASSASLSR